MGVGRTRSSQFQGPAVATSNICVVGVVVAAVATTTCYHCFGSSFDSCISLGRRQPQSIS